MKATTFFASALACVMLASCGFTKSATTNSQSTDSTQTTANATAMGKNAGVAIDALTAQYKADGKLDMTNLMNVANILNLVGASQQVYNNRSDQSYRQGFIKGMISNSINIDDLNAESVTEQLEALVDKTDATKLQAAMQKGEATAQEVQQVATSVQNIIALFK